MLTQMHRQIVRKHAGLTVMGFCPSCNCRVVMFPANMLEDGTIIYWKCRACSGENMYIVDTDLGQARMNEDRPMPETTMTTPFGENVVRFRVFGDVVEGLHVHRDTHQTYWLDLALSEHTLYHPRARAEVSDDGVWTRLDGRVTVPTYRVVLTEAEDKATPIVQLPLPLSTVATGIVLAGLFLIAII